ncbi:hypothetical protein IKJ53_06800, partial [bacterium]|nr:hypothetical protein [bacterium]
FQDNNAVNLVDDINLQKYASANGGAIYLSTIENAKIYSKFTSTKFLGNTASDKGGAIYVETRPMAEVVVTKNPNVSFNKVVFGSTEQASGNIAKLGGAVYNKNAEITFSSSNFYNNNASEKGGALYNEGNGIVKLTKGAFGSIDKTGSIRNGNSAVYGGAIYNEGQLTSTSTSFVANEALQGGAIYNKYNKVENPIVFTKVTFKDNKATIYDSEIYEAEFIKGGAIYNEGNISLSSVTFTNNLALLGCGGAIYNSKLSTGLAMAKVTFTGNQAKLGNAIYNEGVLTSVSGTFKANVSNIDSENKGGALYNDGKIEEIKSSTFTGNQSGEGGVIYNTEYSEELGTGGKINKIASITAGNSSKATNKNNAMYGGVIYNAGIINTIENSKLSYNQSNYGGVIYNTSTGIIENIYGTAMSNEVAKVNGGAIYNEGIIRYVDRKSTLSNNKAEQGNGGAIYNAGTINLQGATLNTNFAGNYGGAIYNAETGKMVVSYASEGNKYYYVNFKSNTATYKGGAIYNAGMMEISNGAIFSANKTIDMYGRGGAIYNEAELLIGSGTKFTSNASVEGGAIYNAANTELTLDSIIFGDAKSAKLGNIAEKDGGAIYNAGIMTIKNTTSQSPAMSRNKAVQGNGGFLYASESSVTTFTGAQTISYNTALNGLGGAIYSAGELHIVPVSAKNNTIMQNNSAISGGAIYIRNASNIISQIYCIDFIKNSAINGNGGAIAFVKSNSAELEDITNIELANNSIKGVNFTDNTAKIGNVYKNEETNEVSKGGAIYNELILSIRDTHFKNNFAGCGGDIYNNGILFIGSNVTFEFVSSRKVKTSYSVDGGAIYNENGTVFFQDTVSSTMEISDYSVSGSGAAIYNKKGSIIIESQARFANNKAGLNGGALYNGNIAIIQAATFDGNSASNGGAIYNVGTLNLNTLSVFRNNIATTKGGIIYNVGSLNIEGEASGRVEMSNSTAKNGGAIYSGYETWTGEASPTKLIINYALFENNIAKVTGNDETSAGGAIYNGANSGTTNDVDSYTKISNSIFNYNQSAGNGTTKYVALTGGGGAIYNHRPGYIQGNVLTTKTKDDYIDCAGLTDSSFSFNSSVTNAGAIYNAGQIITANNVFDGNYARYNGGAVYNSETSKLYASVNDIYKNGSAQNGGAVYNRGNLVIFDGQFMGNYATPEITKDRKGRITSLIGGNGGAIYNASNAIMDIKGGLFDGNTATNGGAIYDISGKTKIDNATFTGNHAKSDVVYTTEGKTTVSSTVGGLGGALYVSGGNKDNHTVVSNSTFMNNSADMRGGAIYIAKNSYLELVDTNVVYNKLTGNTVNGAGIFIAEGSTLDILAKTKDVTIVQNGGSDIALDSGATLNLISSNGNDFYIGTIDKVYTTGSATISLQNKTPSQEAIFYFKDISNIGPRNEEDDEENNIVIETLGNVTIDTNGNASKVFRNANLNLNSSSTFSVSDGRVGDVSLNSLNIENGGTAKLAIDVNLKNGTSDNVTAANSTGSLSVGTVNVVQNSKTPVEIIVGDKDSAIGSVSTNKAESAEATYKITTKVDENGLLRAVISGQRAKSAAIAAPIAAQIGGYLAQINSYDQAFGNLDTEMLLTREERDAREMMNKYASACCHSELVSESQNGINLNSKGLWNRAFATFEKVNLSGGPNVSNVGYGNYFGGDMGKKALSNGWSRQMSAYIGYNGSTQDYDRQCIDQNGGTIGLMETWYKGN